MHRFAPMGKDELDSLSRGQWGRGVEPKQSCPGRLGDGEGHHLIAPEGKRFLDLLSGGAQREVVPRHTFHSYLKLAGLETDANDLTGDFE